jgi:hypothetical protein
MDFVNQRCPASGQSDMDDTLPRSSIGEQFSPLHRFDCIPITNKRFSESIHFGNRAAVIRWSCTLCLLSCDAKRKRSD